jgi:hypothetical protein
VPIIAGRDFTDDDARHSDDLVIVSQSLAQRMFPSVEAALNHGLMWTDSNFLQFGGVSGKPRRIVGIAADIDDTNIVPGPVGAVRMPGVLPIAGAAALLVTAAILASLLPAVPCVTGGRHGGAAIGVNGRARSAN